MEHIRIETIQAINNYKKHQLLHSLILYSFTALTFSLLCSGPFWFPRLCSSVKVFLFVSLPNIGSLFFNPKCLFIVGNVIVLFLVGESKLLSSYSSPTGDIYDELVQRSSGQSLQRDSAIEKKKGVEKLELFRHRTSTVEEKKEKKLEVSLIEEGTNEVEEEKERGDENIEEEESERKTGRDEERLDEDDEPGLPADELNRKVEDFIAKVNKQRRLEAKLLILHEKSRK